MQGVTAVEVVRAVHRAERPGLPAVVAPVDAEPAGRRDRQWRKINDPEDREIGHHQ